MWCACSVCVVATACVVSCGIPGEDGDNELVSSTHPMWTPRPKDAELVRAGSPVQGSPSLGEQGALSGRQGRVRLRAARGWARGRSTEQEAGGPRWPPLRQ